MNQNLFRQFVYVNSSSFGNWLSFNGSLYHEAGPFTATGYKLSSNDVGDHVAIHRGTAVGQDRVHHRLHAPRSDVQPAGAAVLHHLDLRRPSAQVLDQKLTVSLLGEYIRSFRVQDTLWATAQVLRPVGTIQYNVNHSWSVDGQFAYERGRVVSGL